MNLEAIKHYLVGAVVPVIAAAAATWLASKGVLNIFDISKATATTDLDELGVFLVVAGSGWLTSHHLLSGHYSPAAKAKLAASAALLRAEAHTEASRTTLPDGLFAPSTSPTFALAPQPPVSIAVRNLMSPGTLSTAQYVNVVGAVKQQLLTHYNGSPWVERHYAPAFASFIVLDATDPIPTGCWVAEFVDEDPNAPGALGYHEDAQFSAVAAAPGRPRKASNHSMRGLAKHPESGELIPVLKILVKTTLADGASVSEVFSHEALEALVDPYVTSETAIRKYLDTSQQRWVIGEVGDPVQGRGYPMSSGTLVADFVYPAWFKQPQTRPFTSCAEEHGIAPRVEPFALAAGGYTSIAPQSEPSNWTQVSGAGSQ